MVGPFTEQYLEDTARGRLVREESLLRSEWPTVQASIAGSIGRGYRALASGECSILVSVPSGFWFKPRTIWINNRNAGQNEIQLYIGGSGASCSATLGGIRVSPVDTAFVGLDGITVDKEGLWGSALVVSSQVRITGILIASQEAT